MAVNFSPSASLRLCVSARDYSHRAAPSGEICKLLVRDLLVAPDGLDVVVFLERVDELHQRLGVVALDLDLGGRLPRQLGALAFAEHRLERAGDLVEAVDAGPDAVAVLIAFDIFGAGLDRGFEDLVGVPRARRIFDEAEALEPVADAATGAQIAAVLGECGAHVGGGAVAVVGQRLDDDRDSRRAEAL